MAVQVKYHDGKVQWIKGDLFPFGHPIVQEDRSVRYTGGFLVGFRNGKKAEFGSDCAVVSLCVHDNGFDWSVREPV